MKNVFIVILVLVVGVMGYLLYMNSESSEDDNQKTGSSATAEPAKTPVITSGKTLDLSNKGLTEISHDILDDGSVVTFNVSNNSLTGSLPAEIRKLTNLEVLIASGNKMTGIPAEIGQLSKLKTADFSGNNISGLPLEMGNLKNLETLDLRGNPNISKSDLSRIQSKLPNAKILTD